VPRIAYHVGGEDGAKAAFHLLVSPRQWAD
jgi:hypothetical protein